MYTKEECEILARKIADKQGDVRSAIARRNEADKAFNDAQDEVARLKKVVANADAELYEANKSDDQEKINAAKAKKGAADEDLEIAKRKRDATEDVQTEAKEHEGAVFDALTSLVGEQRLNCP